MESASYMHIWACSDVYVLIFLTLKIPRDDILLNSSCIFFWFPEDVLSWLPGRFHVLLVQLEGRGLSVLVAV